MFVSKNPMRSNLIIVLLDVVVAQAKTDVAQVLLKTVLAQAASFRLVK